MGTKSPLNIVEDALHAVLVDETDLSGFGIFKGASTDKLTLPSIVVSCESASVPNDMPLGYGNYVCSVSVGVFTQIDETNSLSDHREAVQNVIGVLDDQTKVKTKFATIGDASAYNCLFQSMDEGRGDRSFMTTITFEIKMVLPAV